MTRIALVVSDVDGTLLTKDKTLTEGAKAAAARLHAANIGFTIVSSRPTIGMRFLIEPLAITLPVGAFNGSSIVDPRMNPVEQHLIPLPAVKRSLDILNEFGVDIWLFTNDQWLTRNGNGEYVAHERHTIRHDPAIVTDFTPHLAHACKIVGSSSDPALLVRCEKAMQEAPGSDKGTFVRTMAHRLGVSTDAVATVGDMQNDLPMFRASGLSFAMGNATDDVKRQATRVTASNEEDGFAKAMDVILQGNKSRQ